MAESVWHVQLINCAYEGRSGARLRNAVRLSYRSCGSRAAATTTDAVSAVFPAAGTCLTTGALDLLTRVAFGAMRGGG